MMANKKEGPRFSSVLDLDWSSDAGQSAKTGMNNGLKWDAWSLSAGESKSNHGAMVHNMKHLLNEFKGLYEEKLETLDFREGSKEETLNMKVRILQSYVNDLSEQNQVLAQTVEDLEMEANGKVARMAAKMRRADQIQNDLELKLGATKQVVDCLRRENVDLKADVSTLIAAIKKASAMQKLDFSSLILRTITLENVNGPGRHNYEVQPHDVVKTHFEDLNSQLIEKEQVIHSLRESLSKSLNERERNMDEISEKNSAISTFKHKLNTVQESELRKVGQIADKDITIMKLHTDLQLVEQHRKDLQSELSNRQLKVRELQEMARQLQDNMAVKNAENAKYLQSDKKLEERIKVLTLELQKREDETQRQQKETLSLQQKKDKLLIEMQAQEQKIYQLQTEQNRNKKEAEHWNAQFEQSQNELGTSRKLYEQAKRQVQY
ncbi:uncharacterized protein LOC102365246 isoform X2 [Latimeria chalumnae]|uniref:uncharacterized protein LOC102365246 isoform X2 n=1 Tax=Latimeria chalumnae TaxID=7897 RepID=UPI0006D8EEC0|nr:PREDICTED: intracellular protein transport protein USO1-like isoform X2 [Latimeria chalumnae]|eukprot:XP_014344753.1 PREDICTED: intracellular protein transport protein USO1-like isoform X2 [Latimeria chalumnae]